MDRIVAAMETFRRNPSFANQSAVVCWWTFEEPNHTQILFPPIGIAMAFEVLSQRVYYVKCNERK